MEFFSVPADEDRLLLYRPLRRLAFVGNEAMARLARQLLDEDAPALDAGSQTPPRVRRFLDEIGFLEPDPAPPAEPSLDATYRPATATLLLTNRCNLRCVYCYADGGAGPAEEMPFELARAAIDYVHQNAVEEGRSRFEVTFHGGGEPVMAWRTLQAAAAYARGRDMDCHLSMVSNGVWTADQQAWILDNLDSLTISCDGAPGTQDRQRPRPSGAGSAAAVLETIHALDERAFPYGVRLTALVPSTDLALGREQLPHDVEFLCRETGCQSMQAEPAFNTTRGTYRPPGPEQAEWFASAFMAAFDVASRYGRRLTFSGARPFLLSSTFCTAPYNALQVTPAGRVVTCYEVSSPQHPLSGPFTVGEVRDGQVVLNDGRRRAFLARLAARREGCRDCFCRWHCAGDCHAKVDWADVGAQPWDTSARCQMNRAITAQMLMWYVSQAEDGVWRGATSLRRESRARP